MLINRTILKFFLLLSMFYLSACGGGGSSSPPAPVGAPEDLPEQPIDNPIDQPVSEVADGLYSLPSDYSVTPIEDQYCDPSSLGRNDNYYEEAGSKLFTWLTGTAEQAHYEPIGEVANYFGFAALRNELRDSFDDPAADEGIRGATTTEVLELLDSSQRAKMYELLEEHRDAIEGFLADRIELIDEFWALKNDEELDFDRAEQLILSIGRYEGEITVSTAKKYADILASLTGEQLEYLEKIRALEVSVDEMNSTVLEPYGEAALAEFNALDDWDAELMPEVTTKIVSWATGTVEDAHLLPPGKIANFFGFSSYRYVDRAGVSRAQAHGLVESVMTPEQQSILCGLGVNVVDYTDDYIDGRENIITELDALKESPFLPTAGLADAYADHAGVGEGRRAVMEALSFRLIESMMSESQIQELMDLRYGE